MRDIRKLSINKCFSSFSECLNVSTVYPSTVIPEDSCPAVDDITVNWAVLGLSLFSMAKIILCIVTVGVSIIAAPIGETNDLYFTFPAMISRKRTNSTAQHMQTTLELNQCLPM